MSPAASNLNKTNFFCPNEAAEKVEEVYKIYFLNLGKSPSVNVLNQTTISVQMKLIGNLKTLKTLFSFQQEVSQTKRFLSRRSF